ncbi:MAG: hypothetical protein R3F25_03745 [Gammaproteobacteria bacterium]
MEKYGSMIKKYFDNVPLVAWNPTSAATSPPKNGSKTATVVTSRFQRHPPLPKIIVALIETDRLMKEIDKVEVE